MPFRPRIVKGGTHESKMCDCSEEGVDYIFRKPTTCGCSNSKFFAGNVPDHWICNDCSHGKHTF